MYLFTPALIASNVASSAPTTAANCGVTFHLIVLGCRGFFSFSSLPPLFPAPPPPLLPPVAAVPAAFFFVLFGFDFVLFPDPTTFAFWSSRVYQFGQGAHKGYAREGGGEGEGGGAHLLPQLPDYESGGSGECNILRKNYPNITQSCLTVPVIWTNSILIFPRTKLRLPVETPRVYIDINTARGPHPHIVHKSCTFHTVLYHV